MSRGPSSMPRRLGSAIALLAAIALIVAAPAAATPIHCGVPVQATGETRNVELKKDLHCSGDGIVVGESRLAILLNGHTITGDGSGVGINFNGRTARVAGGGASIRGFGTGIRMNAGSASASSLRVEFPTGDGVRVVASGSPTNARLSQVTVSNAGANGISVLGSTPAKRGGSFIPPEALLSSVNVFSSAADGISIDSNTKTTVDSSTSKQNGANGILVQSAAGNPGNAVDIKKSRANYNVGWGISGLRGVHSARNTAVGNGEVRQCLIVECN